MKKYLIPIIIFALLVSCDLDDSEKFEINRNSADELLIKSSDQLIIDGVSLELYAELWRDFMPISPADGKNLIAVNWLVTSDSTKMPDYISLAQQFVIYEDSVWTAVYSDEQRETPDYLIERISRNGPKWGPDIIVTVVAEVRNLKDNSQLYLRLENQQIGRTD